MCFLQGEFFLNFPFFIENRSSMTHHYLKLVSFTACLQHHVTNTDATVTYFTIFKVDVDELEEVSMSAKIECMPTFLFFKDGNKIATVEGANQAKILQVITTNI